MIEAVDDVEDFQVPVARLSVDYNLLLTLEFPDRTEFPEHTTLWNAVNHKTVSLFRQQP